MDFSTVLFGKPLNQLAYGDIEQFFAEEREESIHAEFKSFSTKHGNFQKNLEGVIRGICGFLNSEGGVLVWGAPEEERKDKTSEKAFQGTLSPLTEKMEKDWLINKVSDSISPLPTGVNVAILENDGQFVYVFEVQVSNYSPHQYKNTYWARIDGQTKPAPHYLVEALFRKVRYPNIECYLKLDKVVLDPDGIVMDIEFIIFNFSKVQNEENVIMEVNCLKGTFEGSKEFGAAFSYRHQGHQLTSFTVANILHFGIPAKHHEKIRIDYHSLEYGSKMEEIIISFGGKYSPAKFCHYQIDILRFDPDNPDQNLNDLLVEPEENVLASEKHEQVGTTRETILRSVLGR